MRPVSAGNNWRRRGFSKHELHTGRSLSARSTFEQVQRQASGRSARVVARDTDAGQAREGNGRRQSGVSHADNRYLARHVDPVDAKSAQQHYRGQIAAADERSGRVATEPSELTCDTPGCSELLDVAKVLQIDFDSREVGQGRRPLDALD